MTSLWDRYSIVPVNGRFSLRDNGVEVGTYDTEEQAQQARERRVALGG